MNGRPARASVPDAPQSATYPAVTKRTYAAFGSLLKNAASRQFAPAELELLQL